MDEQKATERNAKRMLGAMYRLAKGSTEVDISKEELFAEIRRESLFDISDEQYEAYMAKVANEVNTHRAAQPKRSDDG